MSGSLPDFSAGEKLHAAKLDQAMAVIQGAMDATAGISSTLGKQIADNTSGLASVANTVTGTLSQQVAALQQSINNMTTSYGAMQASMASVLSRLAVLEKATPPPATPGPPTGLRATAIGTSSIALALTAPVGGVAPDNYQWQIATPRGSANWVNGALTGTTTTFSGLASGPTGTPYDIRAISMSTSAGPGGTSAVYQTSTAAAPVVITAPAAPTITAAPAIAPSSITLTLTPAATGSAATSYQWSYRTPQGSGAYTPGPISTGATLTTATFSGLTAAAAYDFIAAGINSAGAGAASAAYQVTTATGAAPSADGTIIPPASSIIMLDGSTITLVGGVVQRGGAPLYTTSGVLDVGVFNGGKLYQKTAAGVWHLDETAGYPWVSDAVDPFVAPPPPPVTVTTVSTPSTATIATTDGHVLSLTPGTGNGGEVMRDGIAMAGGGGTSTIAYNSATNAIYAKDAGGSGWYLWNGSTWINSPDPTSGTIIIPPPPVTTGVFTVTAAGGFLDPTGKPWSMRGLNGGPQDLVTGFAGCFTQFPGLTCVRLNCNSNNNEDALIRQVVSLYTGRGCVVEVEDHWSGNNGNTGWYTTYATAFKSNPYVFMETPNEPNGGSSPQIAVINAIRAAGFTGPIGLQPQGGYDYSSIQAVINAVGRTNIFITPHLYIGGNTDPNAPLANVNSNIATSLGFGLFPCIDEFGEGVDGFTLDQYGTVNTSVIIAANVAGKCGAVYWAMNNGNHSNGVDSAFLNPQYRLNADRQRSPEVLAGRGDAGSGHPVLRQLRGRRHRHHQVAAWLFLAGRWWRRGWRLGNLGRRSGRIERLCGRQQYGSMPGSPDTRGLCLAGRQQPVDRAEPEHLREVPADLRLLGSDRAAHQKQRLPLGNLALYRVGCVEPCDGNRHHRDGLVAAHHDAHDDAHNAGRQPAGQNDGRRKRWISSVWPKLDQLRNRMVLRPCSGRERNNASEHQGRLLSAAVRLR